MTSLDFNGLRDRLADRTLDVCRHYLSNGHRSGNYWVVGDVHNTPGKSMYVRLRADGAGHVAGRWTDAATGEYGDLLDVIGQCQGLPTFSDIVEEAERFLGRPSSMSIRRFRFDRPRRADMPKQARILFRSGVTLPGTLGEEYLVNRGIDPDLAPSLRFVENCYCRPTADSDVCTRPALIAPVTDLMGALTGVHRIYLDAAGLNTTCVGKAPIMKPKRSLGVINGHAVRFGILGDTLVVGEGIENVLSVRTLFPHLPSHAALTAGNLAAFGIPPGIRTLLIAGDNDQAGRQAVATLSTKAFAMNIQAVPLWPMTDDHNADLRTRQHTVLRAHMASQVAPALRAVLGGCLTDSAMLAA
ncbi:DUF7146 domain-containing protein [Asticcacaulis taihuensis]|uniref:DUF7146 domain-containing protein n=1 Tax=Asticcacaulis taihuensis TaxID=260084 RepID=UPI0026EC0E1B|nr:toprim domain-containing protein [Asticcacaulis taihuensis]